MSKAIFAPLQKLNPVIVRIILAAVFLSAGSLAASAQSTEIDFPTPVRANEITGVIQARDVGDPRLTRYFYTLTGTPGDLIITVESRNLNGDVDLFTAGTLRPLAKISMYAGEASRASKSIYLKRREALVLRIEARSPNEDEGSYRIQFSGSFEPVIGETPMPGESTPTVAATTGSDRKTRRVSSVGARIEEPETEAGRNTQPAEPTPSATPPTETAKGTPAETPAPTRPTTNRPNTRRAPGRSTTNRLPRPRQARIPRTQPTERKTVPSSEPAPLEVGTPPAAQPAASARLIIETRDGMRFERLMNTVRRVTVENGMVVVITRDGKIERQPLTNILKMSIEPQQ